MTSTEATTRSARDRVRRLGQLDLGAWIETATDSQLWSIQRKICTAISKPNARVTVPSSFASGKTAVAGRIALAFYDSFTPGTPCNYCGGPCAGAKVITISSKYEHLKDNLWGEIRTAFAAASRNIGIEGRLMEGDLRLSSGPGHYLVGQAANKPEGLQGQHAAHVLVIGDEATSVSDEVARGINGLLASGDARLLLIFNPTDATTYAAKQTKSPRTETIKITAFDTPNFTGEPVPEGAHLVNQGFIDDMIAQGMGPGSYEYQTRVLAEFWDVADSVLIPEDWIMRNWLPGDMETTAFEEPIRQIGVDMATYGTDESTIVVRRGVDVMSLKAFKSGRMDNFWRGPVLDTVKQHGAHYLVYDGDGVGAGVQGYAEEMQSAMIGNGQVLGFRGAKRVPGNETATNARSHWWWMLRRRFENDAIKLRIPFDQKLLDQLSTITYTINEGKIRVETKAEMKKRNLTSPDRADALVYAFAFADDIGMPEIPNPSVTDYGIPDNSDEAHWRRLASQMNSQPAYRDEYGYDYY